MALCEPRQHPKRMMLLLLLAVVVAGNVHGAADDPARIDFEEIWFGPPQVISTHQVELIVAPPSMVSARGAIPLALGLLCSIPYQQAEFVLLIEDLSGEQVYRAGTVMDLHSGRNEIVFSWDPEPLAPGEYHLFITVNYADGMQPVRCDMTVVKASAAYWTAEIAAARNAFSVLEQQIIGLTPGGAPAPYLWLRLQIVREATDAAEVALQQQNWILAERNVSYLSETVDALAAGIAFANRAPELLAPVLLPSLEAIEIRDGGLFAEDKPVFLFGAHLDARPDSLDARLQRLEGLGLNFVAATIALGMSPAGSLAQIETLLNAVRQPGFALALQFDQEDIVGAIMDKWPELTESEFVNMAHAGLREMYAERIAALVVALSGKPFVVGAALARAPWFKYDGEPIRALFVERVRERYPDRIELNRFWRSHLADFDEITIWGEYPAHSYQNRRAYQYEWQSFQQELISHFFAEVKQNLAMVAPDVPVSITMRDTAFLPGETRNSARRELVATAMDISICTAEMHGSGQLYATNYPDPQAFYTLLRSFAPRKPILNVEADIHVATPMTHHERYSLVHGVVWEAVMTGANGLAVLEDSAVFSYPEAMEGFCSAALDVNRLADIVMAFRRDPPKVGILFSDASKIMDDGIPHLESVKFAYEGASFAGFAISFVTERHIEAGALDLLKVLIMPETLAVSDETFGLLARFVDEGGMVARVGTPIPYNERGRSRADVIRATSNTVLVRGMNLPTEYLHALDAALAAGVLPEIVRPINASGYPIEGVRSRHVVHDGEQYLYIVNLRKTPVNCSLAGVLNTGRDLIQGRDIAFPRVLLPLEVMLVRMDTRETTVTLARQ